MAQQMETVSSPTLRLSLLVALSCLMTGQIAATQDASVRGRVQVVHQSHHASGSADVVIWLTPAKLIAPTTPATQARLVQKNKRFLPHVVAVMAGTEIEFPNQDPFFHDVFSIYRGKPFDLGLYESGTSRKVRFSQPGVSYIFCNIHPQMSAAVIALPTPYFAISAIDGSFQISHVPPGHYKLELWYELASESELAPLVRDLEVTDANNVIPAITIHSSDVSKEHLNKYGQTYSTEKPESY